MLALRSAPGPLTAHAVPRLCTGPAGAACSQARDGQHEVPGPKQDPRGPGAERAESHAGADVTAGGRGVPGLAGPMPSARGHSPGQRWEEAHPHAFPPTAGRPRLRGAHTRPRQRLCASLGRALRGRGDGAALWFEVQVISGFARSPGLAWRTDAEVHQRGHLPSSTRLAGRAAVPRGQWAAPPASPAGDGAGTPPCGRCGNGGSTPGGLQTSSTTGFRKVLSLVLLTCAHCYLRARDGQTQTTR